METTPPGVQERLPRAYALIEQGIQVGLHVGAQLFVHHKGQRVADFGIGEARPGVPMTADTIMLWLSSGKPVTAAAIMQLVERGLLDLQQPVASYIPEFAQQGKETITTWHLLTHTVGLRWIDVGWPTATWDEIIDKLCRAKPERDWTPGARAGYHPITTWYLLGELVRRLDGRSIDQYVREAIFLPLGMVDSWIGLPVERYQEYGERMGIMVHTDKQPPVPQRFDTLETIEQPAPGSNARGPMHDLGRFYQMLLDGGELDGVRVLSPASVELMTTRQRTGMMDETFRHVMDWGLGLIINSNLYGEATVPYGYGRYSSPATFGHGGSQSSAGFADPEARLVVAAAFNGMPGEAKHNLRMRKLAEAIYTDLGLAGA